MLGKVSTVNVGWVNWNDLSRKVTSIASMIGSDAIVRHFCSFMNSSVSVGLKVSPGYEYITYNQGYNNEINEHLYKTNYDSELSPIVKFVTDSGQLPRQNSSVWVHFKVFPWLQGHTKIMRSIFIVQHLNKTLNSQNFDISVCNTNTI